MPPSLNLLSLRVYVGVNPTFHILYIHGTPRQTPDGIKLPFNCVWWLDTLFKGNFGFSFFVTVCWQAARGARPSNSIRLLSSSIFVRIAGTRTLKQWAGTADYCKYIFCQNSVHISNGDWNNWMSNFWLWGKDLALNQIEFTLALLNIIG